MRKRRRILEKSIPERLQAALPESEMFSRLIEFEKEIDANLSKRRHQLHQSLRRPTPITQMLRIWVYHTYNGVEDDPDQTPGWNLRVVGKLIPDARSPFPTKKFTSLVKSMQIRLHGGSGGEELIEWHKPAGMEQSDGIEIKRSGLEASTAEIMIHLDSQPPRYMLSQQLTETLQLADEPTSRSTLLEAVWHYVKVMKLQDRANNLQIVNDAKLKKLFGCERMEVSQILKKLDDHLSPCPAVQIKHIINTIGDAGFQDQCYDVKVEVSEIPESSERFFSRTQQDLDRKNKVDLINDQIFKLSDEIKDHMRKRTFYQSLGKAPCAFLNSLVSSQVRERRKQQQKQSGQFKEQLQTSHFQKEWVQEAVPRYLVLRSLQEHGNQF